MPKSARKSPLVAVDTNVLLDRANDDELVIDALETIRRRLSGCELIVSPTVVEDVDTPLVASPYKIVHQFF